MADQVRIEIGFDGGQSLSMLVSAESADDLERGIGEDGCGFDALLRHGRPMLELGAEEARVRAERLVEI